MEESKQPTSRQPTTLGSTAPRLAGCLKPTRYPQPRLVMNEIRANKQPPRPAVQPVRVPSPVRVQGSTQGPTGRPQGTPKLVQDTRHAEPPRTRPTTGKEWQQTSSTSQDSSSGFSVASFSFRRNHQYGDVASSSGSSATESTTTTTTSSGHCCVCNVASDSDMVPLSRRRRGGNRGPAEGRFPWATFLPIAVFAGFALFLLLFSAVAVVETHQLVLRLTPRPEVPRQHKEASEATKRTSEPMEQPRELFETETNPVPTLTTPNSTTPRTVNKLTNKTSTGTAALSTFVGSTPRSRQTTRSRRVSADVKTPSVKKLLSRGISTTAAPRSKVMDLEGDAEDESAAFPFVRPSRPSCGSVLYTFCRRAGTEFRYRPSSNSCVDAAHDAVHTCNRGANRFASLSRCLERCVSAEHPADECFDRPLFTSCTSQDTVSSWWYLQGNSCVAWQFPSDGCPANGSAVFSTADECTRRCIERRSQEGPPCRPPRAVPCALGHLKYPFFAHLSAEDGRVRCLQASDAVLRGYQCLAGANRYRTLDDCNAACGPHNVAPHARR